jgi:hypothetical protein
MTRFLSAAVLFGAIVSSTPLAKTSDVASVIAKATKYVAEYENTFSVLVAEERYIQEVRRQTVSAGGNLSQQNPGGGFTGPRSAEHRRVLRSDYLLVKLTGGGGWMPFRDVFEVDGRKVRDREDKLTNLFIKPSPSSFDQASRIMAESTRHNVGSVARTINIPTLALLLVHPDVVRRFEFTHAGDEVAAGGRAWVVEYREEARPTLIKTTPRGARGVAAATADLPLRGKLWIDPDTGIVVKTQLIASDTTLQSQITVTFRNDPALQLWVPDQMEEFYRSTADERDILGTATYTNYRRFQVNTDEAIKKLPL